MCKAIRHFREASPTTEELASVLFVFCTRLKAQGRLEEAHDHLALSLRLLGDDVPEEDQAAGWLADQAAGWLALGIMCQILGGFGAQCNAALECNAMLRDAVLHFLHSAKIHAKSQAETAPQRKEDL